MSRRLVKLSVWLALLWPLAHAAPPAAAAPASVSMSVSFAEQPASLVRGKSLYRAGRGVALQQDDLLVSGGAVMQLDAGGATLALGPATRLWIGSGGEIVLLEGWLKLQDRAGRALAVSTSVLRLETDAATVTVHASGATTEVFAESGAVPLRELDGGKARRAARLPSEQFGVRSGGQPLRVVARPPAAFLAAMPRDLRDELVVPGTRAPSAAPRLDRAATLAELLPWVAGHKALRQQLQRRYEPPRPAHLPSSTSLVRQ